MEENFYNVSVNFTEEDFKLLDELIAEIQEEINNEKVKNGEK